MQITEIASGNSVRLVPLDVDDAGETYLAWLRDPATTRYTEIPPDQTLQDVRDYIAATNAAPNAAIWRIMVDRDRHVGNIRLSNIHWRYARAEVALLIGCRAEWGKGIATAAIELVSEHAFDSLRMNKLSAGIIAANIGSRRAFEKAGYHVEATLRDHAMVDGTNCDTHLMARFAARTRDGI